MASSRYAGGATRLGAVEHNTAKYLVLREFDGPDGRHYVPPEVVPLTSWTKEQVESTVSWGLLRVVSEETTSEGTEVEGGGHG